MSRSNIYLKNNESCLCQNKQDHSVIFGLESDMNVCVVLQVSLQQTVSLVSLLDDVLDMVPAVQTQYELLRYFCSKGETYLRFSSPF